MAMVHEDGSSLPTGSVQLNWLGLWVGGHLVLSLHSSNELAIAVPRGQRLKLS